MKLRHFSNQKQIKIYSCHQSNNLTTKPVGFWISDEESYGWREWCNDNEFRLKHYKYEHEVILNDDANILYLRSADDIDDFTDDFGNVLFDDTHFGYINWFKVAEKYDGIIITPYIWERRHTPETFWYYGWDCASGCVWNDSAIKEVKLKGRVHETIRIEA